MQTVYSNGFRVGVDIGGTFTDIVFMNREGVLFTKKVPSTPDDFSKAVLSGIKAIFSETGLNGSSIEQLIHGTTIAANTCLEHTGAKTGLITTKGFRDVLQMGRGRMPVMYDLTWNKPVPLVPRYLRLEVDERINAKGEILRPLDVDGAILAIDRLMSHDVESVAVCLLHSYVNSVHEQKVGQLLQERCPEVYVSLSSKVMPLIKEYERTSEAVVNAYIQPVVTRYMKSLKDSLASIGVTVPLYVMQSNGGMTIAEAGMERPIEIIESGPAAGVIGAAYLATRMGILNLLTLDMGGTTCKASIVEDGEFARSSEYEVGAGIHMVSRLLKGKGYLIRVPSIDIAEIGAGGGSILWVDKGGALHVGPKSAGAVPGPACYDFGGEAATMTDANVVLGYLNPNYLVGGDLKLNPAKAYQVIEEQVAKPLGMDTVEAAYGAYCIANANMMGAVTAISSERGRNIHKFTLFAFGGAGPVHAVGIARTLGIRKAIMSPNPGLFSAFGLLFAEPQHHYARSFRRRVEESMAGDLNQAFERMTSEALSSAKALGYPEAEVVIDRYADLRYVWQASELTIRVPQGELGQAQIPLLAESFRREHEKTFGHTLPGAPVEIVIVRVVASLPSPQVGLPVRQPAATRALTPQIRKAYFGKEYGFLDTPVLKLEELGESPSEGPLIVGTYDSTTVVPPGCQARAGSWGTIIIDIKS